jgi:AcrR family transcriptional regulator
MPKIVDHDRYREELISKSFDLFAEKGYGSVTMRQIAKELEVSTGTLYHYFPSKRELFEQLVEAIAQKDINQGLKELEGKETLQEKIEGIGEYIVKNQDYYIKWTYIYVDFYQHQDGQEFQKTSGVMRANEKYAQAIYDLFGITDKVLIGFIYTFLDGLILERLWGNDWISIREQCRLFGKMLTAYLEKQQNS